MKKLAAVFILCLVLVLSLEGSTGAAHSGRAYPVMHPDQETLEKWIEAYNTAPLAQVEMRARGIPSPQVGSQDLLGHLEYTPDERDQGLCGNCWVWAGTGIMEIALDVQEGIKDRLSIQYVNSNYHGGSGSGWACCGGDLSAFADFYDDADRAIPWSNTNAQWQDGGQRCGDDSTTVPAGTISTTPNYHVYSIQTVTIPTQTVDQATAIANIKSVLNQDKAVWFAFLSPNSTAWDDFCGFWSSGAESDVYAMDQFRGVPYDYVEGGGHAVLCVGYNDEDPVNSYWVMLNSWGTTGGRPNGLFRINMDMAYDCTYGYLFYPYYIPSFYWETLDVTYSPTSVVAPTVTTNAATLVEETTATLNGMLTNDGGEACQYRFGYSTTPGGPYTFTGWSIDTKNSGQSFSRAIFGLAKGTKYYFIAQAKNSAGIASGAELTFLTKPDTPTNFNASAVGATQINLSWAKGDGAQKTKIQRKQGSYPANKDDGTQVYFGTGTSMPDMGLTPGTTYYYGAWSYVSGSEQWSDNFAQTWATTSPSNNPPQLSNASVQPPSGTPATGFYYYVNYFDSDGDSPSVKQVYIDGWAYTMSLQSGSASDGVYRYGPKSLSVGWGHNYYFYFEDGKGGTARLLNLGNYPGPTIDDGGWDPWVYDENSDGIIQKGEAIQAVVDYFDGLITKAQVLEVLQLYFS